MIDKVNPHHYIEGSDLLFNEKVVSQTIRSLAALITTECADDFPVVLSVMNGALVFAGQLVPYLAFPLELDYIHATRYQGDIEGKEVTWIARPTKSLNGRNVLILDDILDKGITLKAIVDDCYLNGAKQVKVAVLLDKELAGTKPVKADYSGLKVPDRYVFGCGMDVNGLWRNLSAIYALKKP